MIPTINAWMMESAGAIIANSFFHMLHLSKDNRAIFTDKYILFKTTK